MKTSFIYIFIFISFLIVSEEEHAIKIYIASEIVTLNTKNDEVEAVAVQNSKIIDVGSAEKLSTSYPDADVVLDYQDHVIVPGFIEHHIHPFLAAVTMNSEIIAIDDWVLQEKVSKGVKNREDYLDRLSEVEARHPNDQP